MTTTWDHVLEAIIALGPDTAPRALEALELRQFLNRFVQQFVADQRSLFWWASLKSSPIEAKEYASGTAGYAEIEEMMGRVPARPELILIVTDENPDPAGALIGRWSSLRRLLEEVHYFEFALTDDRLTWAIFDTHHNGLILVEAPMEAGHHQV